MRMAGFVFEFPGSPCRVAGPAATGPATEPERVVNIIARALTLTSAIAIAILASLPDTFVSTLSSPVGGATALGASVAVSVPIECAAAAIDTWSWLATSARGLAKSRA